MRGSIIFVVMCILLTRNIWGSELSEKKKKTFLTLFTQVPDWSFELEGLQILSKYPLDSVLNQSLCPMQQSNMPLGETEAILTYQSDE